MSLRENLISSDSMTLSAKANFNVIKKPVYFEKMIGEETKMQQIPKKYKRHSNADKIFLR